MVNYRNLVETFRSISENHVMVNQFRCGALSSIDIKTEENDSDNYTAVFLNPVSATYTPGFVIFNVNLIVYEIARASEAKEITAHNNTLSILQDIIATVKMDVASELRIQEPWSASWFVEQRLHNEAGWSVNLNVTVPNPLDNCDPLVVPVLVPEEIELPIEEEPGLVPLA